MNIIKGLKLMCSTLRLDLTSYHDSHIRKESQREMSTKTSITKSLNKNLAADKHCVTPGSNKILQHHSSLPMTQTTKKLIVYQWRLQTNEMCSTDLHKILAVTKSMTACTPIYSLSKACIIDGEEHITFKRPDETL